MSPRLLVASVVNGRTGETKTGSSWKGLFYLLKAYGLARLRK